MQLQEDIARRTFHDNSEFARRSLGQIAAQTRARRAVEKLRPVVRALRAMVKSSEELREITVQLANVATYSRPLLERYIAETQTQIAELTWMRAQRPILLGRFPRIRVLWTDHLDADIAALIGRHNDALQRLCELLRVGTTAKGEIARRICARLSIFPRSEPDTPRADHDATPQVVDFILRENLLEDLEVTIAVIQKTFPGACNLHLELDVDPEDDDQWILIRVDVPDMPDDGLVDRLDDYWDLKRSVIPRAHASKLRLTYHIG